MQKAMQWWGVVTVGLVFGAGCSSSDDRSRQPSSITIISSNSAGATGADPSAEAGAGATLGEGGGDNVGAGGGDPCEGEYSCPSVIYWSHTVIDVDLPVSLADAADAVFTACRNDECYSAKGSAMVDDVGFGDGWVHTQEGGAVSLQLFAGSGATPFAELDWKFSYGGARPDASSEHYSLTIEPAEANAATTLFDDDVNYAIIPADPSLVSEGFCQYCSEVSTATVDARAVD